MATNSAQIGTPDASKKVPQSQDVNVALLEDAEAVFDKLSNQEIQLVHETEQLFKRQVDHIRLIDELQNSIPNMNQLHVETRRLSTLVDSSSDLVEEVCSRVRKVDLAKARLEECLIRINDVLDLRTCRAGVAQAMEKENFEEAAMHIKRYLAIDQAKLNRTMSTICSQRDSHGNIKTINNLMIDAEVDEEGREKRSTVLDYKFINAALNELEIARHKMVELCRTKFSRAIQEENVKDIERFFKLFPMLNEHHDGLRRYAEYLTTKIVDKELSEKLHSKKGEQANKLAALYERIAKLIDAHQPQIETYFGPGHLIVVMKIIQKECDHLSRKLLEEFRNETNLQSVAKVVRSMSLQSANPMSMSGGSQNFPSNLAPSKLDPREVDTILNEISLIVSNSEVYLSFIVQRVKEDINLKSEDEAKRQASLLELYNLVCIECELNHLVQEVGGICVMLEQFYLNESSKKAILMDHVDNRETSGCITSSMLDDIFFIIKKCTKRAISTKSNEVFCAVINHCVTLLESTFCHALEERLKNQQYFSATVPFTTKNLDLTQAYNAIQTSRYLQSSSELETSKLQYISALNNLDKACDYIKSLRSLLDRDINKLKPSLLVIEQKGDNQLAKAISCLTELSLLTNRFSSLVSSSLYRLYDASMKSRIRNEFKTMLAENPDLPSIVASEPSNLTSLAKGMLSSIDKSLQGNLTAENYSRLTTIVADSLKPMMKLAK